MLLVTNRDDIDLSIIRQAWADVADGEEARTTWLAGAIARLVPGR